MFLSEVYNAPLQQSIANVDDAFVRMYTKQNKYPKFKNKHSKQSFTYAYPRIEDNQNISHGSSSAMAVQLKAI